MLIEHFKVIDTRKDRKAFHGNLNPKSLGGILSLLTLVFYSPKKGFRRFCWRLRHEAHAGRRRRSARTSHPAGSRPPQVAWRRDAARWRRGPPRREPAAKGLSSARSYVHPNRVIPTPARLPGREASRLHYGCSRACALRRVVALPYICQDGLAATRSE